MIRIDRRNAVFLRDLMMVALAWECAWLARANLYAALFTWKPSVASFVIALATQDPGPTVSQSDHRGAGGA